MKSRQPDDDDDDDDFPTLSPPVRHAGGSEGSKAERQLLELRQDVGALYDRAEKQDAKVARMINTLRDLCAKENERTRKERGDTTAEGYGYGGGGGGGHGGGGGGGHAPVKSEKGVLHLGKRKGFESSGDDVLEGDHAAPVNKPAKRKMEDDTVLEQYGFASASSSYPPRSVLPPLTEVIWRVAMELDGWNVLQSDGQQQDEVRMLLRYHLRTTTQFSTINKAVTQSVNKLKGWVRYGR